MILLFIHGSKFSFEVKERATEVAEEPIPRSTELQNVLVVFTTVEKGDDDEIVSKAVDNVIDVADRTKPSSIVIYPYAHLSSNLADPNTAISILNSLYNGLNQRRKEVYKAPFGWYKSFDISCYGHPLSELSRRITKGVEYQKSKDIEICLKFGFPNSPESTFMKIAMLERLKRDLGAQGIIYSNDDVLPGYLGVKFVKNNGKTIPCIAEDPLMELVYVGESSLNYPMEFEDSTNRYRIWTKEKEKIRINLGNILYFILLNSKKISSTPTLPVWLSPIHVRILQIVQNDEVKKMASWLRDKGIRVQIDDLDDGLGAKIRRAGMDWIPLVAIAGEREIKTGSLTVRIRETSEQKPMKLEDIEKMIKGMDDLLLPQNVPISLKRRLQDEKR
ncbi:Ser-tRNA(Thr) hydrolase [Metallosphaera tengchongensis]|uniref:Ser-tRNA(Thr) hydrolase n=1 Tax=Metallosphaera tengchongensis TaxID=1532350 RepID=A0A6N0NQX0_9CREN|nr:threonyl-tRNA synthetase editing domain-containing protein [Metallosphaera tengchongensis]QKQ99263.1 Ser-tRNA(Thr) hydrolase [Metallosphaera tengchongensis]